MMGCGAKLWWLVVLFFFSATYMHHCVLGVPQVPCLFIFGDSLSDSGNNNNLATDAKVNYLPYGIDFPAGPTGRFTNGRTSIDIITQLLGIDNFIPPYANTDSDILLGVNYASGAAGIFNETGTHLNNFLWGGTEDKKKVTWVSWEGVCISKDKGGLGIKNLEWFNKSLIAKWKWRILTEEDLLWVRLLHAKYEINELQQKSTTNSSIWWKDLCNISTFDVLNDWFKINVKKVVGNGVNTSFWEAQWSGEECLKMQFPRLYMLSTQQSNVIFDCGHWANVEWVWDLRWRRNLYCWEEDLVTELLSQLASISLSRVNEDNWSWILDNAGHYSTKSAYEWLENYLGDQVHRPTPDTLKACKLLWKCKVPKKVLTFAWQAFLDRIPTKGQDVSLGLQLQHHMDIVSQIAKKLGSPDKAKQHLNKCLYYVNIGSNDYLNNYFMPEHYPSNGRYTPDQYATVLVQQYSTQLQALHVLGARKFALIGLNLLGCVPHEIATHGKKRSICVDEENKATLFLMTSLKHWLIVSIHSSLIPNLSTLTLL